VGIGNTGYALYIERWKYKFFFSKFIINATIRLRPAGGVFIEWLRRHL
jgi:hypothetical protein